MSNYNLPLDIAQCLLVVISAVELETIELNLQMMEEQEVLQQQMNRHERLLCHGWTDFLIQRNVFFHRCLVGISSHVVQILFLILHFKWNRKCATV